MLAVVSVSVVVLLRIWAEAKATVMMVVVVMGVEETAKVVASALVAVALIREVAERLG